MKFVPKFEFKPMASSKNGASADSLPEIKPKISEVAAQSNINQSGEGEKPVQLNVKNT